MPYILQEDRDLVDHALTQLINFIRRGKADQDATIQHPNWQWRFYHAVAAVCRVLYPDVRIEQTPLHIYPAELQGPCDLLRSAAPLAKGSGAGLFTYIVYSLYVYACCEAGREDKQASYVNRAECTGYIEMVAHSISTSDCDGYCSQPAVKLLGCLRMAMMEAYRQEHAVYEDEKIKQNGAV